MMEETSKKETKVADEARYGTGRWMCPVCKAIHHFDSTNGCHRPKCSFKGKLERIR